MKGDTRSVYDNDNDNDNDNDDEKQQSCNHRSMSSRYAVRNLKKWRQRYLTCVRYDTKDGTAATLAANHSPLPIKDKG